MFRFISAALFILMSNFCVGQYGQLNPIFGNNGIVLHDVNGNNERSFGGIVQPDGKIVLAGTDYTLSFIARYNVNGSLDNSFGVNGIVHLSGNTGCFYQAIDIKRQVDGKYLILSNTNDFANNQDMLSVRRIASNGSPDPTFGLNGKVTINITGGDQSRELILQSDGKIIVAGSSDSQNMTIVCRLNVDGTFDTSFNGIGYMLFNTSQTGSLQALNSIKIDNNGKILLLLAENILVRLNINGGLDNSFGTNGVLTLTLPLITYNFQNFLIQNDGNFLLVGYGRSTGFNPKLLLARYFTNGNTDPSFGSNGYQIHNQSGYFGSLQIVNLQPDFKIIAAGWVEQTSNPNINSLVVVRLSPDGQFDTTFGSNGIVTTLVGADDAFGNEIYIAPNNSLIVTGYAIGPSGNTNDFMLVNYDTGLTTGEGSSLIDPEISIMPNPANDVIKILGNFELKSSMEIIITDLTGCVSFSNQYDQISENIEIPIANLAPGAYFLKLNFNGNNYMKKFIRVE